MLVVAPPYLTQGLTPTLGKAENLKTLYHLFFLSLYIERLHLHKFIHRLQIIK